jgi:hypothetical protein
MDAARSFVVYVRVPPATIVSEGLGGVATRRREVLSHCLVVGETETVRGAAH